MAEFTLSPTSSLAITASLTVVQAAVFAFAPASALDITASLEVSQNRAFAIDPKSSLEIAAGLVVRQSHALGFSPSSSLNISASPILSRVAALSFSPTSSLNISASLSGVNNSMTACDLVDGILGMWGIFSRCQAPTFAIDRAITDLNRALQLVWNNAEQRDFWSKSQMTVTVNDGETTYLLPNTVQNVVGPCRFAATKKPLIPIGSVGEMERFSDLYLEGATETVPMAFHILRENQSGDDPAKCSLVITPAADGNTDFLLDVVLQAPRYTRADLATCPVVPIPHLYVETLLLPIARHAASSFYLFRQPQLQESIDRENLQAMISLGLADPLPGKAGDNLNQREAE